MKTEPKRSPADTQTSVKRKKVRGTVYLNKSRCKGCGFCIAFCPPKVLEFSDEFNTQGYHPPHLVDPNGCTGCDLCGLYCPDFAIYGVMWMEKSRDPGKSGQRAAGAEP